ncbi:hypothetical protein [Arthrobacter sp. StoSoilB5]|jgi:hypothetical protein|uniref:hypothetical protein n=1 Tax=Arthrobacter sp. StoSoilB5 TaxID=2830992 RepID=UPI001CC54848|nr:hypothetical protein [Arthrobacter sp. StoSoilB5]BCW43125.1 hypothetical protein StoSoilB5_03090 [Arthrobacter sp. StoSoilB5]
MSIEQWWPQLNPSTREWLINNNGDTVPPEIVAEIAGAGGPDAADSWWVAEEESPGLQLPDDAIDWIEAIANEEAPEQS